MLWWVVPYPTPTVSTSLINMTKQKPYETEVAKLDIHRHRVTLERPFDLDATIDSWIFPDIQPAPEHKIKNQLARCFSVNGKSVAVRVTQERKGPRPVLTVEWSATWKGEEEALIQRVGFLLGWDVDTTAVLSTIRADPTLAQLAEPLKGLRPYTQPSLFEALVKAILQQQVSYRFAYQLIRDLVVAYGPRCQLGEQELWDFPKVERLMSLSEVELRAHRVGYKAKYILALTQLIASGELDLEGLAKEETTTVLQSLDALPGVGPWTAALAALSGLRRLEVFPFDDLVVRNLISKLYLNGVRAKREDVETVAKRWGDQAPMVLYFLMAAQVLNLVG